MHSLDLNVVSDSKLILVLHEVGQCRSLVAAPVDGNAWECSSLYDTEDMSISIV